MNAMRAICVSALCVLATSWFARAEQPGEPVLRNPSFEEGLEGWSAPPEVFSLDKNVGRWGAQSLKIVNRDPELYLLCSQAIEFRPGARYRFGVWVKTEGVEGNDSGATICMEWSGPRGWIGGTYPSGVRGTQDWTHVESVSVAVPAEATRVTVTLYLRKGMTGSAWFDGVTVTRELEPLLTGGMLAPSYRGLSTQSRNVRFCAK